MSKSKPYRGDTRCRIGVLDVGSNSDNKFTWHINTLFTFLGKNFKKSGGGGRLLGTREYQYIINYFLNLYELVTD